MKAPIWMLALLVLPASAGVFGKKKQGGEHTPTPLDQYINQAEQSNNALQSTRTPGAIWSPDAIYSSLGMDVKARHVNDMVTILVIEKTSAVATGDVKTQRQAAVQSSVTAAGGLTRSPGPWANLAKANSNTQLQGTGTTSRGATLTATVSARVVNVLPNGYLVVEGIKHVQVNSEKQVITIRGVVRPVDLDPTNAVPSDRVAQMEVQVNGKGVIGDSIHRPFLLYRLLLGLLPF